MNTLLRTFLKLYEAVACDSSGDVALEVESCTVGRYIPACAENIFNAILVEYEASVVTVSLLEIANEVLNVLRSRCTIQVSVQQVVENLSVMETVSESVTLRVVSLESWVSNNVAVDARTLPVVSVLNISRVESELARLVECSCEDYRNLVLERLCLALDEDVTCVSH